MLDLDFFRRLEAVAAPRRSKNRASPNTGADDHLKLLYAFIAARFMGDAGKAVSKQKSNLAKWYKGSAEYIKENLGVSRKPYRVLVKLIGDGNRKGSEFDEQINTIAKDLRPIMKQIRGDTDLTAEQIDAYNSGYRALNRPSERSLALAIRQVGNLNSATHNQWFAEDIDDQSDVIDEMTQLVVKMIKKKKPSMTIDEARLAKEKQPNRYRQWLKVRRQATELYKQALRSVVRQSNKNMVDAQKAAKQLESAGISLHGIPKGFVGQIDEAGKLYTSEGRRLKQSPPSNAKIQMNSKYDPKTGDGYYLKYTIPGAIGGAQFSYTIDWEHKQVKKRDEKVMNLAEGVDQARAKWIKDIKSRDHDKQTLGAMAELVYTFQIRAGNVRQATGGSQTYGLSTLKGKHFRKRSNGNLVIKYPGKSGVPQLHQVSKRNPVHARMIKHLLGLKEEAGNDGYVFVDEDDKRLSARALNRYIKAKGLSVTIKDFRRLQGKVLMEEYFKKHKLPKDASQGQVTAYLKEGALEVGKALGHRRGVKTGAKDEAEFTSATAIGSYIPPALLKRLYTDRGLRVPKFLANKFGS